MLRNEPIANHEHFALVIGVRKLARLPFRNHAHRHHFLGVQHHLPRTAAHFLESKITTNLWPFAIPVAFAGIFQGVAKDTFQKVGLLAFRLFAGEFSCR